jgi:hypothetical protein
MKSELQSLAIEIFNLCIRKNIGEKNKLVLWLFVSAKRSQVNGPHNLLKKIKKLIRYTPIIIIENLELKAVFITLFSLQEVFQNRLVKIYTDNQNVVRITNAGHQYGENNKLVLWLFVSAKRSQVNGPHNLLKKSKNLSDILQSS